MVPAGGVPCAETDTTTGPVDNYCPGRCPPYISDHSEEASKNMSPAVDCRTARMLSLRFSLFGLSCLLFWLVGV